MWNPICNSFCRFVCIIFVTFFLKETVIAGIFSDTVVNYPYLLRVQLFRISQGSMVSPSSLPAVSPKLISESSRFAGGLLVYPITKIEFCSLVGLCVDNINNKKWRTNAQLSHNLKLKTCLLDNFSVHVLAAGQWWISLPGWLCPRRNDTKSSSAILKLRCAPETFSCTHEMCP